MPSLSLPSIDEFLTKKKPEKSANTLGLQTIDDFLKQEKQRDYLLRRELPPVTEKPKAPDLIGAKPKVFEPSEIPPAGPEPQITDLIQAPAVSTRVAPDAGSPLAEPAPLATLFEETTKFTPDMDAVEFSKGLVDNMTKMLPHLAKDIKETFKPLFDAKHTVTQEEYNRLNEFAIGFMAFIPQELTAIAGATVYPIIGKALEVSGFKDNLFSKSGFEAQKHIYETGGLGPIMAAFGLKGSIKSLR